MSKVLSLCLSLCVCVQLRINSDFNTVSFHPVYLNLTWHSRYFVNLFYFFVPMASEKKPKFSLHRRRLLIVVSQQRWDLV